MEQTYTTMMTEEETPEVGPNDIVIHLVNPFKCGMCELEFLDKAVFKEHIFSHLEQIKHERPSSQIVMNIVLPPETPGGVTVTRDILQLGEDGSIKQVIQPANSITLNQVLPLKELEAAGVLKLDHSQPPATPVTPATLPKMGSQSVAFPTPTRKKEAAAVSSDTKPVDNVTVLDPANSTFIKEEAEDVSEIIENTDGTFSVAFKGPNNEMQHIQIIRPEGMKGDMMLELTNTQQRRANKGTKINECDICGKILSSSTNLLRHKMYHSSERPFVCETCGKGFKDISNLKKHTMIHNRIFPCHLCKKSFLRKSLLALHLKRHQARTVFVKSGSGAKEVMLKTFVDDDGTRVEEMSMAALQGQTFEYKKRIMKADPMDQKPDVDDKELETSTASVSTSTQVNESAETLAEDGQGDENDKSITKFILTDEDLLEKAEQQGARKDKKNGDPVDDLPDLEVQDVPKDFVKMYQCGHCGKRTVQRGNMMRHLIHHLRDKPFKCEECPKQFVDKGELVKHIKTHTKPYRCNRCDGAFAHNVQLMKHQESECLGDREQLNYSILDDGQTYRCDICQIEMKRLGNMIKHVGTHTGNRSPRKNWSSTPKPRVVQRNFQFTAPYAYNAITRKFQCNHCNLIFNKKIKVHQHIRSEHTKQQLHQCPDCDSWFHSSEGLQKHAILHIKPFKCELCTASFTHKILLESHKRKHDEKEREEETVDYGKSDNKERYYCKHCDKKLFKKFRMMNHIRRHLDNRPFECSDCNKCFSFQHMLSSHRKIHAKLFTCQNCGEGFTRKLFLEIHHKKHEESFEDKEVEGMYVTPVATNKRKNSLEMEENPTGDTFTCKICASPFSRQVIKLNHERKCREESKVLRRMSAGDGFQCKICQRVATLKHNLMVHIRKNHADIVKIDHSGQINVPEEYFTMEDEASVENSESEEPDMKKQKLSSSSSEKKSIWDWETQDSNGGAEAEEEEGNDDVDENNLDDRYTKTTGGYACNTCRRKFTDVGTLLIHFKLHEEEQNHVSNEDQKEVESPQTEVEKSDKNESPENVEKLSAVTTKDEPKTPSKSERPTRAKAAPLVAKSTKDKETKIKTETTPVNIKKESSISTPTIITPRSSNRPPRSQKIPSRFLE